MYVICAMISWCLHVSACGICNDLGVSAYRICHDVMVSVLSYMQ